MSDRVAFDQIVYFTPDARGDAPVRRACPTWYERHEDGRPPGRHNFEADPEFFDRVGPWLADLVATVPRSFGTLAKLISAGFYVDKPGEHGLGRAMDIDEITWSNTKIRPKDRQHESPDVSQIRRYIGLDAICRSHFLVVFDGWHNALHHDHLHSETLAPVRLEKGVHSATVFCQATCRHVFGADLAIDGAWGERTQAAMDDAQRRTGVDGDLTADSEAWRRWLHEVARSALKGEAYRASRVDATR